MLELVLRLAVSLGVVLGLFWLVARTGARRLGGSRGLMRVHCRQSLSRTASVAVVEVGSRVLVIGVSDGGIALLTELDPSEVAAPAVAEADVVELDGAESDVDATEGPAAGSTVLARRLPGRQAAGRRAARPGALNGSLLSAHTWSQAWAAATSKSSAAPVADGSHD